MADNNNNGGGGGGRQRFTVELKPGETTVVSWKKLLKDAAKKTAGPATSSPADTAPPPPAIANPGLESRLAPGQPAENELKDGHPTRFTDVIEKIERLYMGKHSSDEEDLNDVPDDDQYDTEDSFIDDAELDDYFQVDNSAIKHDGFFINRGKLERKSEPISLPDQQPKKRRRKNLANDHGDGDNSQLPNKLVKVGNKADGRSKKLAGRNLDLPHVVALPSVHNEEIQFQNQKITSANKKSTEIKTSLDQSIASSISNSDDAFPMMGNVDRRIQEMIPPKTQGNKLKVGVETANDSVLKSHDKSASVPSKSESATYQKKSEPATLSNGSGELDQSLQGRRKDGNRESPDVNATAGKVPMQNTKVPVVQRKEGSVTKTKSTNLEKTIGELEKMVAECRPQSTEVHDADMTSQVVKKRLPREIKLKLAKVARQAQANHGNIPNELVNRLMSILGHLVQVRTLKRNLKDMVTMGLTAKKEKDERVQQMKKEVAELIRMRVPYMKSKVLEQQAGETGDFQETGSEEKEIIKRKYGMDDALEDKICDLYDLCVDGVDEDAGPQARKLYYELAHLWPEGVMDNHGIKRAICRAKDRKRALYGRSKDQEKIKRKKLVPKPEGTVRVDTGIIAQPQHTIQKSVPEPNHYGLTTANKSVPSTTSTNPSVGVAASSTQSLTVPDRSKQDKVQAKGNSINMHKKVPMDVLAKKKAKRKPDTKLLSGEIPLEKQVSSSSGDERNKPHTKQAANNLNNPTDMR